MRQFFHELIGTIQRGLSRIPGFSNPDKNSLGFLNSAQFLGALNDNIYKLVLIFYLIQLQGAASANSILAVAGAIFVVPFLLFSSMAGILADRYSKSRLVMIVKASEIGVMILAIIAFALKISWGSYAILFLLATQSAFFGPSKYGIIPELVTKNRVSKANGWITSFTYLAIIAGTFLASFLTDVTDKNYILVGLFCLAVAIAGFISSFGIKYTPAKGTKKKINLLFVRQILETYNRCKDIKHLQLAMIGSSYFLFIGGFTQLNIIPFAMSSLHLTEVAGGYLFLTAALGIAFGAFLSGRLSRSKIRLGIVCLAAVFLALTFFLLALSTNSLTLTVIALLLLGFSGGNFIVPFEAFIQIASPLQHRGHVIAASNFFSFVGVLLASIALYVFNEVFGLTPAGSFAVMGVITLVVAIILTLRLSDEVLFLSSRVIGHQLYKVKASGLDLIKKTKKPILMIEEGSPLKAWLLCGLVRNIHILVPQYKQKRFPFFQNMFYSLHRIASPQRFEQLINHGKKFSKVDMIPCIYLTKKKPIPEKQLFFTRSFFSRKNFEVITVTIKTSPGSKTTEISFRKH